MGSTQSTPCEGTCGGCCSTGLLPRLLWGDSRRPSPSPDIASGIEMRRYLLAALVAGVPCFAAAVHYLGNRVIQMFLVALIAGLAVELGFAKVRGKDLTGGTVVYALLLTLILPPTMPLWMVAAGSAFGSLFGKEVFGGTGTYIFCPPLVAKGFLLFSYPTDAQGFYFGNMMGAENPKAWLACTALTCIALLTMAKARWSNLNTIGGFLLGAILVGMTLREGGNLPRETVFEVLTNDGIFFGALFFLADPACSPRNSQGKWLYGIFVGAIVMLMRTFSTYTESILCAVLLGNLFAPTIDTIGTISLEGGEDA